MKIKIAYQERETVAARIVEGRIRLLWPQAKIHRSERYAPFLHTYLTIDIPEKSRKPKENA